MLFGAMNFPITAVLEEIEAFGGLGFDYLELAMDPPMAHYTILETIREEILQALNAHGMGLVCHLPTFVSTADLTASLRQVSIEEMHRSLETAAGLGAQKVVLHPSMAGGMGAFVLRTVNDFAMDFLAGMVEAANNLGLVLCLENMFPRNRIGVEADDFEKLLAPFPFLQMTLDTGHANIEDRRGKRLKRLVDRFGDRIGHLHVSDNLGRMDDHLAVGQGTVNFTWLVRRLKAIGYDGTITLEVFDTNRAMLVQSRERIKALFAA